MPIIVLLIIVAVVGAVAVVLAGRTGGQAEFAPDRPRFVLPDGPLGPEDIDGIRFAVGVRGYRMDQVDAILDRLGAELSDRDRQLAELRGTPAPSVAPSSEAAPEPSEAPAATSVATPDVAE